MKKQMPFALYNALLCLLGAVLFGLVCLCAEAAEERWYLKWDVSRDRVTQLSDYTRSRLAQLEGGVTLSVIHTPGTGGDLYDLQMETLRRMAAETPLVRVEEIDPGAQPQRLLALAGEVEGVEESALFVQNEAGTRTVRIAAQDCLFSRRLEEELYTIYCGEAQLIGAIERVQMERPPAVWLAAGHGEADEDALAQLILQLRALGFQVHGASLALMQPQAGDVVMLADPRSDLTQDEYAFLKTLPDAGVHLVLACGADTPFDRMERLTALCDLYGLGFLPGWTVENPAETAFFVDAPEQLSPRLAQDNGVLDALPGRLILPRACALAPVSLRPGVSASVLLTTSERALHKADPTGDAYAVQEGDTSGRMALAVLAQTGNACLLQLASADMLRTDRAVLDASENLAFFSACLKQMTGQGEAATLDAGVKQLPSQRIAFDSEQTRQAVSLTLLLALPAALLCTMAAVLLRRRRL